MLRALLFTMCSAYTAECALAADADPAHIEEIIVTALKRETPLGTTPLAVTALSGERLEFLGATEFNDYFRRVPGLATADSGSGRKRYLIRGVSTIETGLSQATVAQYIDEIPITDNFDQQPDPRLIDIERVEVLRGPQGTLFGARSMAGTIRTITRKPQLDRFEASGSLSLSQTRFGGTNASLDAVVNAPLGNTLAVRMSAFHSTQDGYIDNVFPGGTFVAAPGSIPPGIPIPPPVTLPAVNEPNFSSVEFSGGRGAVRWIPTDAVTVDVMGLVQVGNIGGVPFYNVQQTGNEANGLLTSIVGDSGNDDKLYLASGTLTYAFDMATLTAVGSYAERENAALNATQVIGPISNGTSSSVAAFGADTQSWTFEARLASNSGDLWDWLLGGYAFMQDRSGTQRMQIGFGSVTVQHSTFASNTDELAAFGELTFRPIEQLAFTVGARYSDYRNRLDRFNIVAPPGSFIGQDPNPPRYQADDTTLKFQLGYTVSDEIFTYALASQGFRPGGFNPNASPGFNNVPSTFASDSLWNYELGAKTAFFDRRFTFNAALYRIDWKNMQVQGFTPAPVGPMPITYATNASGSQIIGLELETEARFSRYISADWSFNHFFKNALTKAAPVNPNGLAPQAGDPLSFNPESSFNAGLEAHAPLSGGWDWFGRVDWSFVGRRFTGFRATLNNGQPNQFYNNLAPYHLLGLRVGVSSGPWRLTVYAENLTDERAVLRQENQGPPTTTLRVTARPRTIGATISARY